jgi:hypothetical protein
VDRRRNEAIVLRPRLPSGLVEASSDSLQRVARGDLSLPSSFDVLSCSDTIGHPDRSPTRAKTIEAPPVEGFERQRELKTLFGSGVDVARGPQRPFAVELGPIALKTDRPWQGLGGRTWGGGGALVELGAAGGA